MRLYLGGRVSSESFSWIGSYGSSAVWSAHWTFGCRYCFRIRSGKSRHTPRVHDVLCLLQSVHVSNLLRTAQKNTGVEHLDLFVSHC